jgi:hypothetical protein
MKKIVMIFLIYSLSIANESTKLIGDFMALDLMQYRTAQAQRGDPMALAQSSGAKLSNYYNLYVSDYQQWTNEVLNFIKSVNSSMPINKDSVIILFNSYKKTMISCSGFSGVYLSYCSVQGRAYVQVNNVISLAVLQISALSVTKRNIISTQGIEIKYGGKGLRIDSDKEFSIEIFNLKGERLCSKVINKGSSIIPLPVSTNYILRLKMNDKITSLLYSRGSI